MANSSTITGPSTINTMIQDNIGDTVTSVLFPRFVLLYLMLRKDGTKQGPIGLGRPMVNGRPNTGIFVAGKKVDAPRKQSIMGALEFKPLIQFQELQDYTANITNLHDVDPSVENWEDNQIETTLVRPSFRWSIKSTPIEVSLMNMRMTKAALAGKERAAWQAIGDMWLASSDMALSQHCRGINNELTGSSTPSTTTDAPSSVTADLWSKQYSLLSALGSTSNNYAGIDRSLAANAWFRPIVNSTAQSVNVREMLNYYRYTAAVLAPGGSTLATGLNSLGLMGDVFICGNDLFPSFMAQADALKGQVFHSGGFPDYPEVGYNRQMCVFDGSVAVISEPNWPAGYVMLTNLETKFVAIHPEANFTASDPFRQNQQAGGHRSFAATIETQWMWGDTYPAGTVVWPSVTA
jgi:hypothetical protein